MRFFSVNKVFTTETWGKMISFLDVKSVLKWVETLSTVEDGRGVFCPTSGYEGGKMKSMQGEDF